MTTAKELVLSKKKFQIAKNEQLVKMLTKIKESEKSVGEVIHAENNPVTAYKNHEGRSEFAYMVNNHAREIVNDVPVTKKGDVTSKGLKKALISFMTKKNASATQEISA